MPINEWQYTVGGLTLGAGTIYVITRAKGFGALGQLRERTYELPGQDGQDFGREYRDPAPLELQGFVKPPGFHDAAAAWAGFEALRDAWDGTARLTPGATEEIKWRLPGVAEHIIQGRPVDLREDITRLAVGRVDFYGTLKAGA